jgi:hypothetical protein
MIYVANALLQVIQDPRFFCQVWHFDRFLRSLGYSGLSSHFINTLDTCFRVVQIYTERNVSTEDMPSKGVVPLVYGLQRAYRREAWKYRGLWWVSGRKRPESGLAVQMPCNPVTLCRNLRTFPRLLAVKYGLAGEILKQTCRYFVGIVQVCRRLGIRDRQTRL